MTNAGVYRALLLKNTSFQLRQIKTNVFQILWIGAQMGLLIFICNIKFSEPPNQEPYIYNYYPRTTPQPSYSWGYMMSSYWSHIYYVDPTNIAGELLNSMSKQGRYAITNAYQNRTINTTLPMLTSAPSMESIFNTYTTLAKPLEDYPAPNNSWSLSVDLPTSALEFKTVEAQNVEYTMGVPTWGYLNNYQMYNTLSNPDDIQETVQNIISNAILTNATKNPNSIIMTSQQFNAVDFPESVKDSVNGLVGLLGLFFVPSVIMFVIPVFVFSIVTEKQERIVEMMKMMGISMPTYWLANYTFCVLFSLLLALIVIILGVGGRLPMFAIPEPMTYILLLVFNCFAQVSFSFFLSTFFSKARTSVIVSYFFVLLFSGLGSALQMIVFKTGNAPFILLLFPPFALQRGVYLISYIATGPAPHNLASLAHFSPLSEVLLYMFFEAIVYFVLAIYLEMVMPRENGVSYSPFFPITALIRKVRGQDHTTTHKEIAEEKKPILSATDESTAIDDIEGTQVVINDEDEVEHTVEFEDEDCVRERRRAHSQGEFLIKIVDLHKVYPGRAGQPAKNALVKFCLALESGECLGLLGPNGAGKTSLISLLCGLQVPSSGNAFINGFSIKDEMYKVHQILGFCPQHDILWEDLTIEEHLLFYCRLKGYNKSNEFSHVREIAASVGLEEHRHKKVKELSGGMKRRLSISIALVGDSRLVLLDEPTTGLDPDTRRHVWDIINTHKATRSIIITTHNIDEADVLCSKIAIMSLGSLKCIGTSLYLKNKFGAGYKLSAHVTPGAEDEYKNWVKSKFQHAESDPSAGTIDFIIPATEMDVSYVFSIMKANKEKLGVREWAINQMSLEEVFLKMVAHDESQF